MPDSTPPKRIVFFYHDYESLGVEYLSATLKRAGVQTALVYTNLIDFYAFDSSKRDTDRFYGNVASEIVEHDPDVAAFSLLTDTFHANLCIAAKVKRLSPRIQILVGGVHATVLPELTLSYPQVDALCIGEGEPAALGYVQSLEAISDGASPMIRGLVYKQPGRLVGDLDSYVIQEPLDALPLPDKDLFYDGDPSMSTHYSIQCSRGCPFVCSYCINDYLEAKIGARRFRHRSCENVIEELVHAKTKYRPAVVAFLDECFGVDSQWVRRFLPLYRREVGVPFVASVHPSIVDPELIDLMRDAGCCYLNMGVQSLNEASSRSILKRHIRREEIAKAIQTIRSRSILLQCDHILGIPGETEQDLQEALAFYNENRPSLVSVFWLTYYPGTSITRFARELGLVSEREIERIEHGMMPGGMKGVHGFYAINFWMNYFIFLPKWLVRWILRSGAYRIFVVKNPYLASALPRLVHAILHKRDWNRYYMKRILAKKMNNLRTWGPRVGRLARPGSRGAGLAR